VTVRRCARAAILSGLAALLALGPGCSTNKVEKSHRKALYGPSESVLEVTSVLRRHVSDDTYRFEAAAEFTGRNVYRASLLRLESLEKVHPDAMRTGYLDGVVKFAKARALERLRGFDLAATHYREAARHSDTLAREANRSARINDRLYTASQIGIDLEDPMSQAPLPPLEFESVVATLDQRLSLLTDLLEEVALGEFAGHYTYIVREEIERADVVRAHYFVALRYVLPDGHLRAVAELQRVISRHAPSKNRRRHLLDLADLYADLAEMYVLSIPPESLEFDPPRFLELVDAATQIYESVAAQDGTAEKIEASRSLESFLAFTLQVDRDRFSR